MRDILDGLDVVGDVLTGAAVAARCRPSQDAIDIEDIARQAIDLGLGGEGDRLAFRDLEKTTDTVFEIADILGGEGVVERQHGNAMDDRRKFGRGRSADGFRRAVGGLQFGIFGFDGPQALFQRVIFGVGQFRRFLVIIQVAMVLYLGGEVGVKGTGVVECHEVVQP